MTAVFHHVGLNVAEIERSLDFYAALGFVHARGPRDLDADFCERFTGIAGARMRTALTALGGVTLELVEFLEPRGRTRMELDPNDVGSAHLAVRVPDVSVLYEQLRARGTRFLSAPVERSSGPNAGNVVVFGYDPDGNVFQLVQAPGVG